MKTTALKMGAIALVFFVIAGGVSLAAPEWGGMKLNAEKSAQDQARMRESQLVYSEKEINLLVKRYVSLRPEAARTTGHGSVHSTFASEKSLADQKTMIGRSIEYHLGEINKVKPAVIRDGKLIYLTELSGVGGGGRLVFPGV